jgi:hypothetical protein
MSGGQPSQIFSPIFFGAIAEAKDHLCRGFSV